MRSDTVTCLNEQCPKAATCLRQLAMQSMPTEKDYWKIISPKRLATVKGECPFYRSSQKARYAKGFMNMLNSLPYNKRGSGTGPPRTSHVHAPISDHGKY